MKRPVGQCTSIVLAVAVFSTILPAAHATEPSVVEHVRQAVERVRRGSPVVDGEPLSSTALLPDFYERRGFEPAWTPRALDSLLDAIRDSSLDGLDPGDYHLAALVRTRAALDTEPAPGAASAAALDLIATDALIRLGYHARFGKVDQRGIFSNWNFAGPLADTDPVALIEDAVSAADVAGAVQRLFPQHPFYRALKTALARYRAIGVAGGWKPVAAGPTIEPGAADARLPAIRRRLIVEGDLEDAGDASETLDPTVTTAVERFQTRHGLTPDGAIGAATIRAMNVPVTTRVDQLRISLDRARAVMHDLPRRFVLVNVAGFTVYVVDGDWPIWESRVVVGKPFTQTPIFRAEMTYVVLNPTWTVPPGIMRTEIGPGLRRDPNYLAKKGLERRDGQVVQPPGPKNALGRIKLMFPNPHHVYLHDTPSRSLFAKSTRTFSHGCIRVDEPVELAALALDDAAAWSRERLDEAIATNRTRTITLARPLPVLVLYWTATVGESRLVYFVDDPYDRDRAALAALDTPFSFRDPRGLVPRRTSAP